MLQKIASAFLMILIFNVATGRLVFAQSQTDSDTQKIEKIKNKVFKIGTNKRISVTLKNKSKVVGQIGKIGSDSFGIIDKKTNAETEVSYADVEKVSRIGNSKALTIGVIAGLAAGAAILLIFLGKYCNNEGC